MKKVDRKLANEAFISGVAAKQTHESKGNIRSYAIGQTDKPKNIDLDFGILRGVCFMPTRRLLLGATLNSVTSYDFFLISLCYEYL